MTNYELAGRIFNRLKIEVLPPTPASTRWLSVSRMTKTDAKVLINKGLDRLGRNTTANYLYVWRSLLELMTAYYLTQYPQEEN